jgi:hypothetical protein
MQRPSTPEHLPPVLDARQHRWIPLIIPPRPRLSNQYSASHETSNMRRAMSTGQMPSIVSRPRFRSPSPEPYTRHTPMTIGPVSDESVEASSSSGHWDVAKEPLLAEYRASMVNVENTPFAVRSYMGRPAPHKRSLSVVYTPVYRPMDQEIESLEQTTRSSTGETTQSNPNVKRPLSSTLAWLPLRRRQQRREQRRSLKGRKRYLHYQVTEFEPKPGEQEAWKVRYFWLSIHIIHAIYRIYRNQKHHNIQR